MENSQKKVKQEKEEPQSEVMTSNGSGSRAVLQSPVTTPMLEPEVWDHVFQSLSGPDLVSVMNTCPEWNQLLKSRKTTILWPSVLPLVMGYQEKRDVLACRAVTQEGRREIDQVIQKHRTSPLAAAGASIMERRLDFTDELTTVRDNCYSFNCRDTIDRFLEANNYRSYEENPFITREVVIHIESFVVPGRLPIFDEDYSSLRTLLSRFGHHIWRLHYFNWDMSREEESVRNLISFLNFTPNLKALDLYLSDPFTEGGNFNPVFPPLSQLEWMTMNITDGDFMNTNLFRHYGNQLQALTCNGYNLLVFITDVTEEAHLWDSLLSKIKILRLQTVDDLAFLATLMANADWKIEMLELDFLDVEEDEKDDLFASDLFQAICSFRQSLVRLELKFDLEEFEVDSEFDIKSLPQMQKLRTLELHLESSWITDWFWKSIVATCGNLQEVHFIVSEEGFEVGFQELAEQAFEQLAKLEKFAFTFIATNEGEVTVKRVITRASILGNEVSDVEND